MPVSETARPITQGSARSHTQESDATYFQRRLVMRTDKAIFVDCSRRVVSAVARTVWEFKCRFGFPPVDALSHFSHHSADLPPRIFLFP
jgi:hypothetical protein